MQSRISVNDKDVVFVSIIGLFILINLGIRNGAKVKILNVKSPTEAF